MRRPDGDFHPDITERAKCTIFAHPTINSALEISDDDELDKEWVIRNAFGVTAVGLGLGGIFFGCSFGRVLRLDADPFHPFRLYSIVVLRSPLSSC